MKKNVYLYFLKKYLYTKVLLTKNNELGNT